MKLKEKTHRKFIEFFSDRSRTTADGEFEMAFAEIQRATGTASVTLKRALVTLVEEGVITMVPGRNSRYARFTVVKADNGTSAQERPAEACNPLQVNVSVTNLEQDMDLLKRRLRSQEIAISLLQDRLADLEEKLKY